MTRSAQSLAVARGRRAAKRAADIIQRAYPASPFHAVVAHSTYRGTVDVFGVADFVQLHEGQLRLYQITHGSGLSARKKKIGEWLAQHPAHTQGVWFELWGWVAEKRHFRRFIWCCLVDGWEEQAPITTKEGLDAGPLAA